MPLVTLVIPARDRVQMLCQALASVLRQEVDLEVVVTRDALERVGSSPWTCPRSRTGPLDPPLAPGTAGRDGCDRDGLPAARWQHELQGGTDVAFVRHLGRRTGYLPDGDPIDWADLLNGTGSDALHAGDRRLASRLAISAIRQRHPGAVERLVRTADPFPRRPPCPELGPPTNHYERSRPPRVVSWPPGVEVELNNLLAVVSALGGPRGDVGRRTEWQTCLRRRRATSWLVVDRRRLRAFGRRSARRHDHPRSEHSGQPPERHECSLRDRSRTLATLPPSGS